MKIAILGYGAVGYAVSKAFEEDYPDVELRICDYSTERLKLCRGLNVSSRECITADLRSRENVLRCIDGVDIVVESLPSTISFSVLKICGEKGVDVVSISYIPQDPFELDPLYRSRKNRLIVDAGIAPGLSNIIIGSILSKEKELDSIAIYVGGLPVKPIGPLLYSITWSPIDLLEEYTRKARIVKNHRIVEVDPLTDIEIISIPGLGEYEAFYSDGLRTLLKTLSCRVSNAYEKTLRYPGHIERIRFLRELGLMDRDDIELNGIKIKPIEFLAKVLDKKLRYDIEDIVIMYINAKTLRGHEHRYLVVCRYDRDRNLSAMAKATGFTAYAILKSALIKYRLSDVGVIPPEFLGMKNHVYNDIIAFLKMKGIEIKTM